MEELSQSSTLARVAVQKPEIAPTSSTENIKVDTSSGDGKDEPTPQELIALNRPPYLVDLLEAHEAYGTFDFKDQALEIDTFIQAEMERKELEGREGYDKVLKGIWKQIKPTESVYTNTERLRDYVRIQQKLIDALEEKKAFEAKDPPEMSAKELERYLKEHVGKY